MGVASTSLYVGQCDMGGQGIISDGCSLVEGRSHGFRFLSRKSSGYKFGFSAEDIWLPRLIERFRARH